METARPSSRAGNQQKNVTSNPTFTPRPRAASERDFSHNGPSRQPEENRSPAPAMPKAFQGMLRNTTETGDIGLFSIKPSRIPQAPNTPRSNSMTYAENAQKPRHNFQPYGVPIVDDRRRLPSYNRDTTSEVIVMYESPNQRSGSRPEDSDYRSYSMTQASSYTLSNHRSFASLRSQQEGNALLQRPRSPFAYPTRLRRPGVRPSSPALTDGGLVDYSRRAEIERTPYGPGINTASPGSLYAQKRRPPGPYYQRSEANRSTPSLLSQQSPPRHSSNPNLRQSVGSQGDWPRRPIPHSGNTSPARSTLSRTSTTNLNANVGPLASTTTTPGKLHPPSPLYYDYTEDFEISGYNQPEPLPPPAFRMAQPIPEDEPASSNHPAAATSPAESRIPVATSRPALRSSNSATSVPQRSFGSNASQGTVETNLSASTPLNGSNEIPKEETGVKLVDPKRDTKIIRPSGMGYGARELSTHVEETFGLPSTPSFEMHTPDEFDDANESQISADEETSILKPGFGALSTRSSAFSLGTNLQQFPRPPGHQDTVSNNDLVEELNKGDQTIDGRSHHSRNSASFQRARMEIRPEDAQPLPRRKSRGEKRASIVDSLDMGFEELDKIVLPPFDGTNILQSLPNGLSSGFRPDKLSKMSKSYSKGLNEFNTQENTQPQFRARYDGARSESMVDQPQTKIQQDQRGLAEESLSMHTRLDMANVPNFSHQIPSQLTPRSESPMIAPKPISPARQLRLRNSIPQIMKALPPLPQDPPIRAGLLMNRLPSFEPEHQLSPKLAEDTKPMREPQKTPQPISSLGDDNITIPEKSMMRHRPEVKAPIVVEERKSISEETTSTAPPLPRLKLKTRASSSRPISPPDARPWNMEESYPWSNQNLNVGLPPMSADEEPLIAALPKFRLKVTRASNSSHAQGTMIVNRDSTELKGVGAIHVRTPKDLFTPASGLENMFRQVGKHLHTRASESIHRSDTDSPILVLPVVDEPVVIHNEDVIKSEIQHNTVPVTPAGHVAQSSFSDDSSHIEHRHKLRTRLSNLRARLPFNYGYRAAAYSSDDIIWERQSEDPRTPHILQSAPNLHSARATFSGRPQRKVSDKRQVQGGRLRGKVRGWLKGAKTAIVGHRRSRSSLSKKSDDERAHLTVFD